MEAGCIAMPPLNPWPLILIAILIAGLIAYSQFRTTEPLWKGKDTSSKDSCEDVGGVWGPQGLSQREMCNLPTTDAGRRCRDKDVCQGACVAKVSREQLDAHKGMMKANGKCTAWTLNFGCHAFVQKGMVYGMMCID